MLGLFIVPALCYPDLSKASSSGIFNAVKWEQNCRAKQLDALTKVISSTIVYLNNQLHIV
jgi:hypothetical protein